MKHLPARVGPFEIVGVLGEGGMGVVYSARVPGSGARVAVKTVTVVDERLMASMRRELHALGRLSHPGVVRVLSSGVEGGRPWYAMELVEGTTLAALRDAIWMVDGTDSADHLNPVDSDLAGTVAMPVPLATGSRGEAPPVLLPELHALAGGHLPRVITVIRRLLGTLAFVHGEGIVHRDIKPQNVVLRADEQPVLVDFGLASRTGGATGREVLDLTLDVVGTPAYMAPEQIRGDAVDSRVDLYAVGCVLYELLTGRPPFIGDMAMIMEQHLRFSPRPPSDIIDGCPRELDQLVLALLEKRPRDRIGHAEDAIYVLDALGARPDPARLPRPRTYVYRPGLAGRDAAMAELSRAARRALAGDGGGCVLIAGESGAGKTYLAMEAARANPGLEVVSGSCALAGTFPHGPGGQPLHPFAPLLQLVADRCTALGRAATDALLGARGKILAEHEPSLGQLPGQDAYPDPPPLRGAARRDRLLAALADTLAALARKQPLLLVLDDLQWADDVSLRFLTGLGDDWFRDQRVLIVGTYRLEEATPGIGKLLARPYTRRIELGSLDETSVGSLVADMLAVDAPPDALVRFLARHSKGNPFFVAEYLRVATAEGLLRRGDHKRVRIGSSPAARDPRTVDLKTVDLTALALPLTMPGLVGRRLDGLSPAARGLAAYGSVIGRELDPELLRDAAGVSEAEALDGTAELVARQVLEPTDEGGLRFVHDKLCEVAYERLEPEPKKAMHRAVAEAIERRVAGTAALARFHATLAHHYLTAEVEDKAIEHLEQAGARALLAAAYTDARDLHRKLLELDDRRAAAGAGAPASRRARWERRLGEACFNLGDLAACEAASLAAMRRLGRPTPATRRARAVRLARLIGEQALHRLRARRGAAPGVTGDAARGDKLEIALAGSVMAWRYFFGEDMLGMVSMALCAANALESTSPAIQLALPHVWLGYTSGLLRLPGVARFYFSRSREAAQATGDTGGKHFSALMESVYHISRARWSAAESLGRAALAELRDAGDPTNADHHVATLACMLYYVGRFEESMELFDEMQVGARARHNPLHEAWGLYGGAMGRIAQGRFDESLPRLHAALAVFERLQAKTSLIIVHGLCSQLHARAGRDAEALRAADEVSARVAELSTIAATIVGYIGAAEAYLELADRARRRGAPGSADVNDLLARARAACSRLRRFALWFPFAEPARLRYGAQLAALEGEHRAAQRGFARAIELSRRLAMPYDEAQALWLASRYVPDRGRAAAAREIFARLGCAWHVAQIDPAG
ncbi:MAG TPA: AAA family ATPase [Kofleriaceae bacterium]|nr:AAA family ATPase [Kofleriaceae bacterium]